MDKPTITVVPPLVVDLIWDKIKPYLKRVVDVAHNEATVDGLHDRMLDGQYIVVTIAYKGDVTGVALLEVITYDTGLRALFVSFGSGDGLANWLDELLFLARAIARDLNCTELRAVGARKGWLRKLEQLKQTGWSEIQRTVKFDVGED